MKLTNLKKPKSPTFSSGPTKKPDEINLLAKINSAKDLKQLAEDFGLTKEQIKKQL